MALIQRPRGVAFKAVTTAEERGDRARLVDRATADRLTRVAVTNPMPEEEDVPCGPEKYGTGFGETGILETFARYDHPVVPVVVLRTIPWILESLNEDGTWGGGSSREAAPLAVLTALAAVGDVLSEGLRV